MKRFAMMSALLALGVAVLVTALACTSANGSTDGAADLVNLDASYSGREVEATVGSLIVVSLDSNPSTGFRWELAAIGDEKVLQLSGQEFRQADAQTGLLGAGGQEVWTFKAVGEGKTSLALEYSRPWAGGEKAVQTFTATVTVK